MLRHWRSAPAMPQSCCGKLKRESWSASSNDRQVTGLVRGSVCLVDIEERCAKPSLSLGISYHADKWQVAIAFSEIQSVPDDEFIGNAKTQIVNRHLFLAAFKFVQQRGQLHTGRATRFQICQEITEGQSRIDDILYHQNVTSFNRDVQIFEDAHFA